LEILLVMVIAIEFIVGEDSAGEDQKPLQLGKGLPAITVR
jgi:hypothetical protein